MGFVIIAVIGALIVILHEEPAPPSRKVSSLVVVLPDAAGRVGMVTVKGEQGDMRLDTAYAAAEVVQGAPAVRATLSEGEVNGLFASALGSRPLPPVSFTLYFITGGEEIAPESQRELDAMLAELKRRQAPEVTVIGHTDRVGSDVDNDRLSLRRAERVRGDLLKMGIPADLIGIAGRGEREPLVPTADNVAEPRNRRVEISIR